MRKIAAAIGVVAIGLTGTASAAEITLIAPGGIRAAVVEMIPAFEKKTGNTVKATFGSGNGTKQRVVKGDAFDVPIVQPPYPDVLASGNVVNNTEKPLAPTKPSSMTKILISVGAGARPPVMAFPLFAKLHLFTPLHRRG